MADLDPKYLKGLKYRSSEQNGKAEDGTKIYVPTQRALKKEDVLSWKEYDQVVVIVAADGQKHQIDKYPKTQNGKKADS